mgnify:CR=1 FL=1
MFITILIVITINFFIFRIMPGNPAVFVIGNPRIKDNPEAMKRLLSLWGLNRPLHEQYFIYLYNLLTFRFGISFFHGKNVGDLIMEYLPWTLLLLGSATVISIVVGILIGAIAAAKPGSKFDVATLFIGLFLYSLPVFWIGLILLLVFAYYIPIFPLGRATSALARYPTPLHFVADVLWHMFLPLLALTLISFGGWILITRNAMLDAMTEDYILTARAKGLDEKTIIYKHAMRNAMLPLVTVIALAMASIVSGAILTETVFSWPGMGTLIYEAVMNQDYPVLEGAFYVIALITIFANFIADLLYGFLDPRVKY